MHLKKQFILPLLFLFAVFYAGRVHAQESLVADVSYTYLQKLIDTAKKYYPQVRIKATQIDIARTSYHQSKTSWLDVVTPSYLYNPDRSTNLVQPVATNSYQLALTVNLGSIISKPFLIHNARQAMNVAKLEQDEYILQLTAQVKKFYFAYLSAQAELRMRLKSAQDAQSNAGQMKYKYEKGETTLTDYSEVLTALSNQNSYRIQAEVAVLSAKADLEAIVGKRLEDIK